jgi:hypothetical protein
MRGQYEKEYGPVIVRPVHAHCSERIRITWALPDGTTFVDDDYLAPGKEVIDAKRKARADHIAGLLEGVGYEPKIVSRPAGGGVDGGAVGEGVSAAVGDGQPG